MALVGQILIQATQLPQSLPVVLLFLISTTLTGKGISTSNSPRKNQEPASLLSNKLCFPTQPKPAFSANGLSKIGAESTKGRKLKSSPEDLQSRRLFFFLTAANVYALIYDNHDLMHND